jgi:hypothetical protein
LHKTVGEIESMSYSEYLGWIAYFSEENDPNNLLNSEDSLIKGLLG